MAYRTRVRDQLDMKLHNRALIWELIHSARPVSRAQLAKMTAMSPTSITRIVGELIDFGLLRETPATHAGVGRKATMLDVDEDALLFLGVDMDVDTVQTCLVDLDNRPRSFLSRKTNGKAPSPEQAADTAREMFDEMLAISGIPSRKVGAVGVSVCGIVNREDGKVVVSPQLHWHDVDLRSLVAARFIVPDCYENDVKAAIVEEYVRHEEYRAGTVAYLTVGSGIGSAVMCDGTVLRGGDNAAGEIGHITIHKDGETCDCGRRGCLYTYLSETALLKRIRARSGRSKSIDRWAKDFREGAGWAQEMMDEAAEYLAIAINHILCSFNPDVAIVGGKLLYTLPELLDHALAKKQYLHDVLQKGNRVLPSRSMYQDSVIGAAILAKDAYMERLLKGRD